jgi:signal transduction histidine kinase
MSWDVVSSAHEVLAALPEIIVQIDGDHMIRTVNRYESSIFSRPPYPGAYLDQVLEDGAHRIVSDLIGTVAQGGTADAENNTERERLWISAQRLESAPLTLLVFHDRTNQRSAEQAVADLIRDRSSFLASIGHELRAPLTAVVEFADLLSEPSPKLDEAARHAMAKAMTDQAWDLAGIVEDLLAVARIEIGELTAVSVPVNLVANVAQVIESMGTRGSGVVVDGDRTITGLGDPARFRQVVRNLLSNALSHGAEPITVEVTADSTFAALRVRDHGPGVDRESEESIFDEYTNTNTRGRVGIGLWVSREIISQMGGQLSYRREGDQTIFQGMIPVLKTSRGDER